MNNQMRDIIRGAMEVAYGKIAHENWLKCWRNGPPGEVPRGLSHRAVLRKITRRNEALKRILAWQLIMDNLAEIEDRPGLIKPLLSKAQWTAQDIVSAAEIPVETKLAMALTPKLLEKKAINRFCYEMGHKALALVNSRHIPCILVLQLKQAAPDSQHYATAKAQFLSLPVQDGVWHCVRESVMDHLKESAYASACLAASAYVKGFQHDAVRWARAWQEGYARERGWQLQCLAAILEGKEQPICTM